MPKVSVFLYVGRGRAEEVGAVTSTMPKFSVWLVAMSTERGLPQKEAPGYETVTRVTLSWILVVDCWYTRSVSRSHCARPLGGVRSNAARPSSSTWTCIPASYVL